MSADTDQHKKIEVEPRELPQDKETVGQPFEQLNANPAVEEEEQPRRTIVQPRALPNRETAPPPKLNARDAAKMKEAIRRMVEEGQSREEVAQQLQIEPLKLRRWETAYHEMLQRDLNEGEFHDTDAQMRDLTTESRERFQDNWEQVMDKMTERRLKLDTFRSRLMAWPFTKWLFRNDRGDLDYATITGMALGLLALGGVAYYLTTLRGEKEGDKETLSYRGTDFKTVEHNNEQAIGAVQAFLTTKTWQEKLPLVLNAEQVKPRMEAWYAKRPAEVHYDRIGFVTDDRMESEGRHFILLAVVASKFETPAEQKPFYITLEKTAQGYKVDWEVSAGYQSMPLDEFVKQKPKEPVELRLHLKRGQYFNFQFTADKYWAFEATHMELPEPLHLYAPIEDKSAFNFYNLLAVTPEKGAIVKVRFPQDAKSDNQLELVEIVSKTWLRKPAS